MALRRVMLRDFVLVPQLELDLADGFTALTGETGAGKSILVDALQLALGARADVGVVRAGCARAEVSLEFDTPAPALPWLHEAGFDTPPDSDALLIRRVVDASGKSRAWINGSPATATQLRELGEWLVDIHGQHAWQSLTKPAAVRALLDAYAASPTAALAHAWRQWQDAAQSLRTATEQAHTRQQEMERLAWQIGEVDKLNPLSDEWDDLNAQHTRLSHHQSLQEAATQAHERLTGDDAVLSQLSQAHSLLERHSAIEPALAQVAEVLATSLAQAEDAAHSLAQFTRHGDLDPQTLAQLDERMALWMSLARRYRVPPSDLHSLLQNWKQSWKTLESQADLDAMAQAEQQARSAFDRAATAVSRARQKAAPKLARSITQAMQELGMQGGQFEVKLAPLAEPASHGVEQVEFWVAGHAGQPLGAVGKVASGGELSRLALAIAVTTSQLGQVPTLIFDEVDSGIGGAVAQTVGRLMRQLGHDRQVLAVTHLPQVAASAHHHLIVSKSFDGHTTRSTVSTATGEVRTHEVARMLGGETLTPTTLAHARELLTLPTPSQERRP